MQGRIIALRVSDADFEKLEGLKESKHVGWNQLLLVPVEVAYGVTLETARPLKKVKVEEEAEPAETSKKKGGKGKKAESAEPPATEPGLAAEVILEDKGLEMTEEGDVVEPHM